MVPQPNGGCIGPSRELYKVWCNPQVRKRRHECIYSLAYSPDKILCILHQPCDPPEQERNKQCDSRGHEAEGHNFGGIGKTAIHYNVKL